MTSGPTHTAFSQRRAADATSLTIAGFQRAGMLDWPGRVTSTVFLSGCTLRCPYCHNPGLAGSARHHEPIDDLLAHLRDRRAWLDGVVITGGEPTADSRLPELLSMVKAEGLPIKLDTNGTRPHTLSRLLDAGLVDFVALDVKATGDRYERATGIRDVWPAVDSSITTILESGVDHEFRTTCYPLAVGSNELVHIAARLVGGQRYVLQQFRAHRTLDPAAVSVKPHSSETLRAAAERCSMFVPTVVRGV